MRRGVEAESARLRRLGARAMAVGIGSLVLAFGFASEGRADSIEASLSDAKSAFDRHARSWMAGLEKNEAENRRTAPVYSVAQEAVIRFDGYGDDYETQVKATGHATAPYVGILRYKENLYTCLRDDQARCTVTRSVPVSEIFSFKNGRWTY